MTGQEWIMDPNRTTEELLVLQELFKIDRDHSRETMRRADQVRDALRVKQRSMLDFLKRLEKES